MRISEERMKKTPEVAGGKTVAFSGPPGPDPAKSAMAFAPADAGNPIDDPAWEWITYGQMTPGFLKEVARLLDEMIGKPPAALPDSTAAQMHRQIQMMKRVRAVLDRWAYSTEAYRDPLPNGNVADLIQMALMARAMELKQWGIRVEFEDAAGAARNRSATPAFYQSILHVLQYCIERMRGGAGSSKLAVRLQHSGDRLETSFLCEISGKADSALSAETRPPWGESLRLDTIHFRAAQALLDSVGGTLALENISESRKAVRVSLNVSSLPVEGNLGEKFHK